MMQGAMKHILFFVGLFAAAFAQAQGPIVFIDGNGSEQEAARATVTVNRDDQTMELARDLLKSCPEISITRKEEGPLDYFLLLNRGREGGFVFKAALSQFMLLDRNKNVLASSKQGTVAKAARDACKAILADWKQQHRSRVGRTDNPTPLWNKEKPAQAEAQK
jgi:hypothetical protein